jgi:arylsulfatase A-like enzyme
MRSLEVFQEAVMKAPPGKPFFGLWELECTHVPYCYKPGFDVFQPTKAYFFSGGGMDSLINDYDNAILCTDHIVKLFFDFLMKENLWRNTVVVLASDHGEAFFDHENQLFHGGNLHQEQIRVPLVIHVPEQLGGVYGAMHMQALRTNQSRVVQLADILPTIVDFAQPDQACKLDLDGLSLMNEVPESREILAANAPDFPRRKWVDPKFATVNSELMHFISYSDSTRNELYNLKRDPSEKVNLWKK